MVLVTIYVQEASEGLQRGFCHTAKQGFRGVSYICRILQTVAERPQKVHTVL